MRIIGVLLILSKLVLAQYDSTMYDLIKSTYERSFDKQIITSYLHSNSPEKIKAAILSISQSEDTSFVPALLNLDLSKFGNEVCFAIGQLGNCSKSLHFLWSYLESPALDKDYSTIFYSIGKIGDKNDLQKLVRYYNSFTKSGFPNSGISKAILQFQLRGITDPNVKSILEMEVEQFPQNPDRVSDALFVLVRYNGSEKIADKLIEILSDTNNNAISKHSDNLGQNDLLTNKLKEYALMNFQRLKNFNASEKVLMNLLNGHNELLKIELAKTIVYWDKKEETQNLLPSIFKLINDNNTNVAIQAAVSLRNLDTSFVKSNKEFLRAEIINILKDPGKESSLKSEIFLSGYKLLGDYEEFLKIISDFNATIECKIEFSGLNPNKDEAVKTLIDFYKSEDLKIKIEALNKLLGFLNDTKFENDLGSVLMNALSSNFAPLVSIAADGLDSTFIENNKSKLLSVIEHQINQIKDDPDFLEATLSLINLSERIDNNFLKLILEKTKSSTLYSVRKFIAQKIGTIQIGYKETYKFDDIWQFAFKYSKAKIITSKGAITIKFNPEAAPVSVGNFCKLANEHFYDGILFHRVVPGFVIQAGDPTSTGWGGPGYDIISEFSDISFNSGYVGMASAGKDTEGSQFFIMQGSFPHLDGRYTNFAKVLDGMDVVLNITQKDKILSIQLIE